MSTPQTANGYCRIANELLEAIVAFPFSKRQMKMVMAVIRKTYGFNKKSDVISFWQLSQMTGIDRANTGRTVAELDSMRVLDVSDSEFIKHGQPLKRIGLNKQYQQWQTVAKTTTVAETTTVAKSASRPLPNRQADRCQNSTLKRQEQKTRTKDTSNRSPGKPTASAQLFAIWYRHYPNKKARAQAEKAWAKVKADRHTTAVLLQAIRKQKQWRAAMHRADAFVPPWKHPATWLNGECWYDDLDWPREERQARRRSELTLTEFE